MLTVDFSQRLIGQSVDQSKADLMKCTASCEVIILTFSEKKELKKLTIDFLSLDSNSLRCIFQRTR